MGFHSGRIARRWALLIVVVTALACTSPAGRWAALDVPAKGQVIGHVELQHVACGGPTSCLALGSRGRDRAALAAAWDGTEWRMIPPPPSLPSLASARLDCASPTWCVVFDGGRTPAYAVWDGTTWTPGETTALGPDDVSCPAVQLCFGTRGDTRAPGEPSLYRWDGSVWAPVAGSEAVEVGSVTVDCGSVDACTLVASAGLSRPSTVLRWQAGTWTTLPVSGLAAAMFEVDCLSADRCVMSGAALASGDAVLAVSSGGRVTVTGFSGRGMSVSCAGPSFCLAHDGERTAVLDGGGWQAVAGGGGGTDLACASATACFALRWVQSESTHLVRWNGSTWTDQGPPAGADIAVPDAVLQNVSCPTATWCLAVGRYREGDETLVLAETWDGARWTAVPDFPASGAAVSPWPAMVDCPAPSACVVATGAVVAAWDGRAWTTAPPAPVPGSTDLQIHDLSCGAPRSCLAVGTVLASGEYQPFAQRWDGTAWMAVARPLPETELDAAAPRAKLSCATPTFCARLVSAMTNNRPLDPGPPQLHNAVQFWDGRAWTRPAEPAPFGGPAHFLLLDIDCTAADACVATGWAGQHALALRWNGQTWTTHWLAQPAESLGWVHPHAVSCATTRRCLALVQRPEARDRIAVDMVWGDTGFSSIVTTPAEPTSGTSAMNGASCTSDACLVVGATRNGPATTPVAFRYQLAG
jgi:hypothetical protein